MKSAILTRLSLAVALTTFVSAGCATSGPTKSVDSVQLPPTSGQFDYQLGGAYPPPAGVTVLVRDSTAQPIAGIYTVCYVNGFQTQPDQTPAWTDANEDLLLHDEHGALVVDPDWPDEYVLDPTTSSKRERILSFVGTLIDRCAVDGFAAVEVDNLDTWTRFPNLIDPASSLELAAAYAERAHIAGLAIGQKNAAEAAVTAEEQAGFDFAITESCAFYDECSSYTEVYGPHVLDIEYTDALQIPFDQLCSDPDRVPMTVLRDRDLVPAGDAAYEYEHC